LVHGELIKAGRTELLTYKQLRSLERIDAKKAREGRYFDLAREGVIAAGQVGRGVMQGNITGPVVLFLLLASNPQLLQQAYDNLATFGTIAGAVLSNVGSGIAKDVGTATNDFLHRTGLSPNPQPKPPPPPPPQVTHLFWAHTTGYTAFGINSGDVSFQGAAERDKWITDTNGSWITHVLGNFVNEKWETDSSQPGVRINDKIVPAPPPIIVAGF
jgi:hypothetical protein